MNEKRKEREGSKERRQRAKRHPSSSIERRRQEPAARFLVHRSNGAAGRRILGRRGHPALSLRASRRGILRLLTGEARGGCRWRHRHRARGVEVQERRWEVRARLASLCCIIARPNPCGCRRGRSLILIANTPHDMHADAHIMMCSLRMFHVRPTERQSSPWPRRCITILGSLMHPWLYRCCLAIWMASNQIATWTGSRAMGG